mmetsp:Transcript_37912/g.55672  ORF Transcript_37912/g.55672 Transcript_37912/m.55672 type:complete len:185 (+) Transcript_37912:31-585(+)
MARVAVLSVLVLAICTGTAQCFSTGAISSVALRAHSCAKSKAVLQRPRAGGVQMKLDVAPQVVAAFPTAEEQNKCLAVVNAAINELNRNPKATSEMGKATECTYILAAGRPQNGVISVRFSCKFSKSASPLQLGRFLGGADDKGQGSRGSQVAQVSCQCTDAELLQLSIDVDGGWGRRLAIVGR